MKKTLILLLIIIFQFAYVVSGVPVGSFNYYVDGQTVVVTPTLSDTTFYKWRLKGDYTSETEWIPIADIGNHKFILNWDTEYRITLEYKDDDIVKEFHRMVRIGHDPDPDDNDTVSSVSEDSRFNNILDQVPDWLKDWFNDRSVMDLSLIMIICISLVLFFIQNKNRKKILITPIQRKKYRSRGKKT